MFNCLQNWPEFFLSLFPYPFAKWLCSSSHKKWNLFLYSLKLGWLSFPFWTVECRENSIVVVPSLGLKRTRRLLLTVLEPCDCHGISPHYLLANEKPWVSESSQSFCPSWSQIDKGAQDSKANPQPTTEAWESPTETRKLARWAQPKLLTTEFSLNKFWFYTSKFSVVCYTAVSN